MQITLNGERKSVVATTVAELAAELKLDTRKLAVERNRAIVPRSLYEKTSLQEGDAIEIVQFIGGG